MERTAIFLPRSSRRARRMGFDKLSNQVIGCALGGCPRMRNFLQGQGR